MFHRKIALNTVSTLTTTEPDATVRERIDLNQLRYTMLTAEAVVSRTAVAIGLVIVSVIAAKSAFRTLDTVVEHVYNK